jgi:hypothetical protein
MMVCWPHARRTETVVCQLNRPLKRLPSKLLPAGTEHFFASDEIICTRTLKFTCALLTYFLTNVCIFRTVCYYALDIYDIFACHLRVFGDERKPICPLSSYIHILSFEKRREYDAKELILAQLI